jgi:hypothetical protein
MTITEYKNGNSIIAIHSDGTRIISYEDDLRLDYPLNIDIRVSTKCSFGFNPSTGTAVCGFCHESATMNGADCNYDVLFEKLNGLPSGIELAIGSNELTDNLVTFLEKCKNQGWICNVTVNQGHLKRDKEKIIECIDSGLIRGLGISYRSGFSAIPSELLNYENTVIHVINGIDSIEEVLGLKECGVKKVLVLGEKNFGFNLNKVNLWSSSHRKWYMWIPKLFDSFDVVSFDNLALEQLKIKRFIRDDKWDEMYQGEHSFYINAVSETFSPSSRSPDASSWNSYSIKEYFQNLEKWLTDFKNTSTIHPIETI